jgi:lysophospholipase L1-like esterase
MTSNGGSSATGGMTSNGGSSATGGINASGGSSAGTGGKSGSGGLATGGRGDGGTTGATGGTLAAGGSAGSGDAGPDALSDGRAAEPGVRLSGRFNLTDKSSPSFGWSDSAIFARFEGSGATLRMDGSPNQFQMVIDGTALPSVLKIVSGTSQYQVATGLSAGTHELIVWKRTEGNQGDNRFLGLDVVGGQLLAASPAPDRRIEVYGDSITAGYGLDGQNCSGYQQDKQNSYLTYAAVAARTLSAELHTVAWSGIGMYRNYNEPGPSTENMPAVYARISAIQKTNNWDFSTWQPHAVVVNLGTNDASTKGDPGAPYETNYLDFVRTLRQKYPDTFFVLTIGPMLSGDALTVIRNHIQNVIKTRAGEGDSKMSYLEFPTQSPSDGIGCDSHPNATTNAKMATALVGELKTRLGW